MFFGILGVGERALNFIPSRRVTQDAQFECSRQQFDRGATIDMDHGALVHHVPEASPMHLHEGPEQVRLRAFRLCVELLRVEIFERQRD